MGFLSLIAATFSHISRAVRWNMLFASMGYKARLSTTFYALMIGYFANLAVPRIGEITRCGIVSRQSKIPFNKVLGSVVAERAFDLVCMILIMFFVAVIRYDLLGEFITKNITDPMSRSFQSGSTSLLIIVAVGAFMLAGFVWLLLMLRKKQTNNKIILFIRRFAGDLGEGLKSIWKLEHKFIFLGHTLFIWLVYAIMTWVCFYALPETSSMTFSDGIVIMIIGSVGIIAPSPGGIGAYQYIVSLALIELYAVSSVTSLTLANIIFFSQWFFMIALGGFSFLMLFLIKRKNAQNTLTNAAEDIPRSQS
jgi:glycosyltransferase 2 family protein